jgi:hypothetical protein
MKKDLQNYIRQKLTFFLIKFWFFSMISLALPLLMYNYRYFLSPTSPSSPLPPRKLIYEAQIAYFGNNQQEGEIMDEPHLGLILYPQ